MGGELVGWKKSLALMPYGARFRNHRRLAHQLFGSNATMKRFLPMLEQETRRCLNRIVTAPESLSEHIRKTAAAVILQISHGYMIQEKDDPFVELAERTVNQLSLAATSGGFLVDLIPIRSSISRISDWFPGAGFKRTDGAWASALNEFVEKPHNYVKQEIVSGADTTVPSIYTFFKAMLLYPDVQAKAQAEIDAVIGDGRLPRFDDREHLPYVNALALEVTRWHTVAPAEIKEPEFDPNKLAFGFGLWVLADASIFISCAMVLAVFNISKYSENGIVFEPDTENTSGTISHPASFKCTIKARSEKALELINEERSV
ncbi:cytochrome P450 [Guyanagaster necrorhizus]|uniref:Cytochrome P450 n=1 Tax=Guyanagaster necrorhizus TaxID=856835 RepID=A0A9P8AXN9_9AGAR|nr:cytochrome P450 [Guyanagaster necrorhizus MCA 3950]KAG7451803.1 cytochrome P450 [Guyanagaster necrorhizus MCA 3950]